MSTETIQATSVTKQTRYIAFRIITVAVALTFIVLFGVWQSIFGPWFPVADPVDHGWVRTPELHRIADAAAAALMGAVAVAALVAAIAPARASGLVAWIAGVISVICVGSVFSTLVQGHEVLPAAAVTGVVLFAVMVVPMVLLHPERKQILRGGAPEGGRPGALAVAGAVSLTLAGLALAVVAGVWRAGGGVFESVQEDDFLGLIMLGVAVALGALVCLGGRAGWQRLMLILGGTAVYCLAAAATIALT
jgi:hypothetical protein